MSNILELTTELKKNIEQLALVMTGDVATIPNSSGMVLVKKDTSEFEKRKGKSLMVPSSIEGFVIFSK